MTHIEQQAITSDNTTIKSRESVHPPIPSCPSRAVTNIEHLLDNNFGLIMGESNGYHRLCLSDGVVNDQTTARI